MAQIVPNCGSVAKDAAVQQFNVDVAAVVATASGAGKQVSLVDMYDPFKPSLYSPYTGTASPYMADTLHPNQAGGNLMATAWYNGIQATAVGGNDLLPVTTALSVAAARRWTSAARASRWPRWPTTVRGSAAAS